MLDQLLPHGTLLRQLPTRIQDHLRDILGRILKLAGYESEFEHGSKFRRGYHFDPSQY